MAIEDKWDLPMLVQEVLCRLDCHLRRDTEFSELGKHAKLTFDRSGGRLDIHTSDSMSLSFELDREYPRDTSNFCLDRIDVPDASAGDMDVVKVESAIRYVEKADSGLGNGAEGATTYDHRSYRAIEAILG